MSGYLHDLVSRAMDAAPVLKPRLPTRFEPVASELPVLEETQQEQIAPVAPRPAPTRSSSPESPSFKETASLPEALELHTPVQLIAEPVAAPQPPARPGTTLRFEREIRENHEVRVEHRIETVTPPLLPPQSPRPRSTDDPHAHAGRIRPTVETRFATRDAPADPSRPAPTSLLPNAPIIPTRIVHPADGSAPGTPPASPPQPERRPPAMAALLPKPVPQAAAPALRPARIPRGEQAPPSPPFEAPVVEISIGRVEVRAVSAPAPAAPARSRAAAPMQSLDDYLKQKNGGNA